VLIVVRPSGSSACPLVLPESLGDSAASGAMVGLPSMVALHLPLEEGLDLGEDSFVPRAPVWRCSWWMMRPSEL
jgi:hypothetical protein